MIVFFPAGMPCSKVMLVERMYMRREMYISIMLDRAAGDYKYYYILLLRIPITTTTITILTTILTQSYHHN